MQMLNALKTFSYYIKCDILSSQAEVVIKQYGY